MKNNKETNVEIGKYKTFLNSLPKKRMGAGVILRNLKDEILFVRPNYKEDLEIPGGIVEEGESPYEASVRELKEELGLKLKVGKLLVVDYNSETENYTESLMFIFDGGKLNIEQINEIKINEKELLGFEFIDLLLLTSNVSERLCRRIKASLKMIKLGASCYLENQEEI